MRAPRSDGASRQPGDEILTNNKRSENRLLGKVYTKKASCENPLIPEKLTQIVENAVEKCCMMWKNGGEMVISTKSETKSA